MLGQNSFIYLAPKWVLLLGWLWTFGATRAVGSISATTTATSVAAALLHANAQHE